MIVYIITKLELGGAQKVCLELLRGCGQEHSTMLISGNEGVLVDTVSKEKNITLLAGMKREVSFKAILGEVKNFLNLILLLRSIKKEHPHALVHTHSTKAGIIGRWAAFFAGIKKRVHTVHGFGFHRGQKKITWSILYLLELITSFITTHYIFVSHKDLELSNQLLIGAARKKTVIHAAVDDTQFYPATKTINDAFVIGSVSCFKPQKNLLDLLKAFHTAKKNTPVSLRLEIIGDGVMREAIESFIKDHNLKNDVVLWGWQTDVGAFMRNWNAFVLTSLWEGLPCAIIEARLCKLPVIANNVGGIEEVIKNGENGFLTEAGNWQETATKIITLAESASIQQKMASWHDDLSDFKNKTMVKKHLSLYNSLLSK